MPRFRETALSRDTYFLLGLCCYPKSSTYRLTSFLFTIIEKTYLGEHVTFVEYTGVRVRNAYNLFNQTPECRGSPLKR
jgi:hypothetical protein